MVCVRCLTYNQVRYIEETLAGFCIQIVDYPILICIVDDASSDGESELLKKWAQTNLLFEKENAYSKYMSYGEVLFGQHKGNKNIFFAITLLFENHKQAGKSKLPYCEIWDKKAKYTAKCEGDDYWIDPYKLSKQVTYMEEHLNCAMCYTKARICYHGKVYGTWGGAEHSFSYILNHGIIPTLTRLERRSYKEMYIDEVKPFSRGWLMSDLSDVLYYSLKNSIGFINDYTAVYRILDESASHSKDITKLFRFYDSADEIRYFFVNNYIEDNEEKKQLASMIKRNEVNYKLYQYSYRFMIVEMSTFLKENGKYLTRAERIRFKLMSSSKLLSPMIIYFFGLKKNIRNWFKMIYLKMR